MAGKHSDTKIFKYDKHVDYGDLKNHGMPYVTGETPVMEN